MLDSLAAMYLRLLAACGVLAGLGFAALAVLISLDIVLRNIGIINFPWLLEVSEYVVYYATFLAAPWVLSQGAHVRVDILVNLASGGLARAMELIADLVGLSASVVFLYYSVGATVSSYFGGRLLFKELVIPEWLILIAMPVSGALLTIEFVLRTVRVVRSAPRSRTRNCSGL